MSKGPLITRTELRKRKENSEKAAMQTVQKIEQKNNHRETDMGNKKQDNFYRKNKKIKKKTNTRTSEQMKIRERSNTLTKAIIIVSLLLIVVIFIVLNI